MKIAVGLSGGVDSSVAAALLKEQGHDVYGITMKVWDEAADPATDHKPACIGPAEKEDVENAARIAAQLGIPFRVIDLTREYKDIVLNYFTSAYLDGKTPNPCMHCNHRIKFGALLSKARQSGIDFEYFATGHYATVKYEQGLGRYTLSKAEYLAKDQSYFLARLSQTQLARVLFPLSGYTKSQVRELSRKYGLISAEKPESQDFYSGDYTDLFAELPDSGSIVDTSGKQLGTHKGIIHYTIGQRRGLGISHPEPLYVVAIDSQNNKVVVGTEDQLYRDQLVTGEVNWVSIPPITEPHKVQVKIRYRHPGAEAEIRPLDGGRVHVSFYQPIRAISPGQTAVFYNGSLVLGAGTIESSGQPTP